MSTNQKVIFVNSAFKSSGTSDNFQVVKTESNFNNIPKKAKLLSASIPYVWDNITVSNNSLSLIELPGPVVHSVSVAIGYYTGKTLATELQTTLNAVVGKLYTYTVTFDTNSFEFTIAATGNFQLNFTVSNTIASALGFDEIITTSATTTISTKISLLLTDLEVCVKTNLIGGIDNGIVTWFPGSTGTTGILATVPITACHGEIIQYQANQYQPWQTITQSSFSSSLVNLTITFQLILLSGLPIDMRGTDWTASILLEF